MKTKPAVKKNRKHRGRQKGVVDFRMLTAAMKDYAQARDRALKYLESFKSQQLA